MSLKEMGRGVPLKWFEASRLKKWAESSGPRCPGPRWLGAEMTRNRNDPKPFQACANRTQRECLPVHLPVIKESKKSNI